MRILCGFLAISLTSLLFAQDWELIWSDEFNGNELDVSKWSHDIGNGYTEGLFGWGNAELQYYQPDNTEVNGGTLTIEARREPQGIADEFSNFVPYYYSSSKITTEGLFEFRYGRVEARIRTVDGQGMWPAFWMLAGGCWPETGEIDIMEQWGSDGPTNITTGAAHLGFCGSGSTYVAGSTSNGAISYAEDFHTYAVEWQEDLIVWYVDDTVFHTITPSSYPPGSPWPFNNNDWYLILNLAITSSGPNGSTPFPNDIEVDYVRVYQGGSSERELEVSVDVSELGLSPTDVVYINGTFNDWCGSCNPLSEVEPDIWSGTLSLPAGEHEYKFTVNGWDLSESFTSGASCTKTTGDFVNRVVQLGTDTSLPTVCWNSCAPCSGGVTFQVDMSEYPDSFGQVFLSGTFNEWCGNCIPMEDEDQDGIYAATLPLAPGLYEWKYQLDEWAVQEEFDPASPCTFTTGPFTNRIATLSGDEVLDVTCWNSCEACPASPCASPTDLDVQELGMEGSNPRIKPIWVNPEGSSNCEIRGGRVLSPQDSENPMFVNLQNTLLLQNTTGTAFNNFIRLFDNPNINFQAGSYYGFEVRCECQDGGEMSEWSGLTWESVFQVPEPPAINERSIASEFGSFQIFPNPASGRMSIQGPIEDIVLIEIYDTLGRKLYADNDRSIIEADMSGLTSGIYIVRFVLVDGRSDELRIQRY